MILIERYSHEEKQTIGNLYLLDSNQAIIHRWDSLELPWLDNQRNISCIPEGTYRAHVHYSPTFGKCLWIKNVPNRSEILVHYGNFHSDILGCVLIGKNLKDINKDGHIDVTSSRDSMRELLYALGDKESIKLKIVSI